jgi:hypothetical protein
MDTLTLSLIVMVVAGVAAVLAVNVWQQRSRQKPEVADRQPSSTASGTRAEPRLDPGPTPESPASLLEAELGAAPPRVSTIDPLVDEVVTIELAAPISTERIGLAGLRRIGTKPLIVESLMAGDESNTWGVLMPGQSNTMLRIALQLANRRGPLNAMEFSEFAALLDQLSDPLGVLIDAPEMSVVLARARALDAQLLELDGLIGFNLEFDRTLSPADLVGMAQANAMSERGSERWARLDEQGQVVFSLSLGEAPSRVSLLLDYPRVAMNHEPWSAMLACARQLCEGFGARLLDDQARPLSEASIEALGKEVARRQQALRDAGIEPGSATALRVFH